MVHAIEIGWQYDEFGRFLLFGMSCASECFYDFGKFTVLKMRWNNQEMTGDCLDAHSHRTRGGILSELYASISSSFDRMRWD